MQYDRSLATLQQFQPSPFVRLARRVRELSEEGRSVITLYAGEPDFQPPENIQQAAIAAMKRGENKYTAPEGTHALKSAIIRKFQRENDLRYSHDQIIVSAGCKQVIMNALLATIDDGDEVIIPTPYWMSYPEMVRICGGKPVVVRCPENNGFKLNVQDIAAAITPRTKWVFLNSPNNPCGVVYSEDELRDLADVIQEHEQVCILSDDIYEHIRFEPGPFRTIANTAPSLFDRVLTVNGVSKSLFHDRVAYRLRGRSACSNKGDDRDLVADDGSAPSISQAAAVEALDGPAAFVPSRSATFQTRRDLVLGILDATPGLRCFAPKGAFYIFCNCAGDRQNHAEWSGHLVR